MRIFPAPSSHPTNKRGTDRPLEGSKARVSSWVPGALPWERRRVACMTERHHVFVGSGKHLFQSRESSLLGNLLPQTAKQGRSTSRLPERPAAQINSRALRKSTRESEVFVSVSPDEKRAKTSVLEGSCYMPLWGVYLQGHTIESSWRYCPSEHH